ncbi:hypothetical protein [Hymenobacter psoromatis]|uniref:hypothetical protein n=1 Tax=Hymenobacter psoromatis TaxID=1484116 RepID=UPI001CBBA659|nr:hypothetical protein [Hymenobacter psoromatis]
MSDENKTYSVRLRLRREVVEDSYVSVIIDEKVTTEQEDGSFKIDFEKLAAEAIRISTNPQVDWQAESSRTEPHPLQTVMPDERTVLDSSEVA